MGSHVSVIGVRDEGEVDDLISRAIEQGHGVDAGKRHRTVSWLDNSGAGVFCHLTKRDKVVCMTPYFRAEPVEFRFKGMLTDRECRFCSGICVANYRDDDLLFPLGVQVANVIAIEDRLPDEGATITLRVAFFGENVGAYADEEAYEAAQRAEHAEHDHSEQDHESGEDEDGPQLMAPKSFVPGGLFEGHDGSLGDCFLAGTLSRIEKRENSLTGAAFWWARVDTLELTIEVLLDPEDFDDRPDPGMILAGSFWAVGEVESGLRDKPRKRSWLRRLRG